MITVSDDLTAALERGGFQRYFVADVIVDGERVLKDLRLASGTELRWDSSTQIRAQGEVAIEYSDELGRSVVPEDLEAWFTPYATRLNISMVVRYADVEEKILRGTFLVRGVGRAEGRATVIGDRRYTVGSKIRLRVADEFRRLERERFSGPASPSGDTGWAELGLLSGMVLARNVADVNIDRSISYDTDKLVAVHTVGRLLGGTPYLNPANQIAIDPDTWGAETAALVVGESGTITQLAPDDMDDEEVYNQVVVRSYDDDQVSILATAEVASGPLRYGGPFGRVPYFASSEFITTEAAAQTYADALLPKVATQQAVPYAVQAVVDPRREVGDVVPFTLEDGTALTGRIQYLAIPDMGPMTAKLLVDRD